MKAKITFLKLYRNGESYNWPVEEAFEYELVTKLDDLDTVMQIYYEKVKSHIDLIARFGDNGHIYCNNKKGLARNSFKFNEEIDVKWTKNVVFEVVQDKCIFNEITNI